MLDYRRIGYGAQAVAAVLPRNPNDENFGAGIFSVSLPILSDDGSRAVLISTFQYGRLDGGGGIVMLERQPDGKWQQSDVISLWVS